MLLKIIYIIGGHEMSTIESGWERDKRVHFDEIVMKYEETRPEWPNDIFEDIINYSIKEQGNKALEIGAGTGKATVHFLNKGYDVTAVEISNHMAEFLKERFKDNKDFSVLVSTFENTVLEENNYNLIYAASAFHWVDAEIGCPKVFRLLKNGGIFALLRYNFNYIPSKGEDFYEEIQKAYEKYFFSYYTSQSISDIKKMTKKSFEKNPRILTGYGFEDLNLYGFHDVTMNLYEKELTYNADEWINLLDTLSNHRNLPESNKIALYSEIKEIIIEHGNLHKVDCIFQLYMGRK